MTKPIYCESLHYKLITTLLSHKDLLWLIVHNFHNNSLFSGTWVSVCLYQIWDFCRELTRQVLDFLLTNLKVSTLPPSHCLQLSLLIKIQEFLQCHPPPPPPTQTHFKDFVSEIKPNPKEILLSAYYCYNPFTFKKCNVQS